MVIELNDANLAESIKTGPVVVDFWAPWCGPCRKLGPVLEEVAAELEGKVKVYKLNTDDNTTSAQSYGISALPSVLMFKDGEVVERMVGLMPKSTIISNIEKHLYEFNRVAKCHPMLFLFVSPTEGRR